MFGKIEVLFIFFIIIGISAFIGLNIIKVVERKINNMKVTIPSINVPEPKVTLILKTAKGNCNVSCVQQSSKNEQSSKNKQSPKNEQYDESKVVRHIESNNVPRVEQRVDPRVEQRVDPRVEQRVDPIKKELDYNTTDEMSEIRNIMSKNVNYYDEDDVLTDTISKVYKSSIRAFNETDYAHN